MRQDSSNGAFDSFHFAFIADYIIYLCSWAIFSPSSWHPGVLAPLISGHAILGDTMNGWSYGLAFFRGVPNVTAPNYTFLN